MSFRVVGSILNWGGTTLQGHFFIKPKVLKGHFSKEEGLFSLELHNLEARAPSDPLPPVPTSLIVSVSPVGGLKLQVTDKYRYKQPHTSWCFPDTRLIVL